MKPRATFHWPWLLFWCTVGVLMWLAAFAGLRALGLTAGVAVVELVLIALGIVIWMIRHS